MAGESLSLLDAAGISRTAAADILNDATAGCDDGELFIENRRTEMALWEDGRLKTASFDESQGFGMRAVAGETAAYAHSTEVSVASLKRAADVCRTAATSGTPVRMADPERTNRKLYPTLNPADSLGFGERMALLATVDGFTRGIDPRVRQVTISLAGDWQDVEIVRPGGGVYRDTRPLMRFNISVTANDGKESGTGSYGFGGRADFASRLDPETWQAAAREAVRQSLVALDAKPSPAGEMDVLLGPGWPGILLHEAVGHGLEGDHTRKKMSAFSNLMGQRIASPGVTVVDDGTIPDRRGSLTIDDEGTPSSYTPLIEDGILVGFMQDRMNARLMGMRATGNGRRQSYAHIPMPRMTNTYMLAGKHEPDEILRSVKRGLFAKSFGGGQVDIVSGKFVFSCTEAYLIEDGRLGQPVKGATIIGNGADALTRIAMIGNDMALDPGIGTCGKQGQGVPVGVGQPSLRIDRITVGGTAA